MSLHDHYSHRDQGSFLTSPAGLVLIGFLVIAGVLLFTEHRFGCTHLAAASPMPADAHVHARRTWWSRRSWTRRS